MTILHSTTYGCDLSTAEPAVRRKAVGDTLRLARSIGMQVRHPAQGWATRWTDGEPWRTWWPAEVNVFVDYVEDEARQRLGSGGNRVTPAPKSAAQ